MVQENSSLVFHKRWFLSLFLVLSFVLAAGIRLYDLHDLPLDFHPARQLQSMLKSRGMFAAVSEAFTPAQQQIAIGQWKSQPIQEPEVMEHLAVWTYQVIGHEDLWFPRFYAILFWLAGGVGLYLLLKDLTGTDGAVVGTLFYLFAPFGISASRAFMPDPLMLALILWATWALFRWSAKQGWGRAVLAGLLCALAIYVKLTAVFFIAGAFLSLALATYGIRKIWTQAQFWAIGLLAVLPGAIYNLLGIYVYKFIGADATSNRIIPSLLISPLSYIDWNTMIGAVVGYAAFLLAVVGCFLLPGRKAKALIGGLAAGYVLFGAVFIYYFTTHDYYHLPLIFLVAIGLAGLAQWALPRLIAAIKPAGLARALIVVALLAGVGETLWQVRNDFKRTDYRSQAQFWADLGQKLQGTSTLALTEDYNGRLSYWGWYDAAYMPAMNELVHRELAGHEGDVAATFAADAQGKQFFLVTLMDDPTMTGGLMDYLQKTYPIYDQGSGYIIFDLRTKK